MGQTFIRRRFPILSVAARFALVGFTCGAAEASAPANVSADERLDDSKIASRFVGTWSPQPSETEKIAGTSTYYANGTGTVVQWLLVRPENKVRIDFHWKIAEGMLIEEPVKATIPPGITISAKTVDRVVSINDRQMVLEVVETIYTARKGVKTLWNKVH